MPAPTWVPSLTSEPPSLKVTRVPSGSESARQPSVSVASPRPAQCAAYPTYVAPALSVKTKFAVHWAPSVYIIVPGWIFAVAAGAHVWPIAGRRSPAAR